MFLVIVCSTLAAPLASASQRQPSVLTLIALRRESPAGNVFGPLLDQDLKDALGGDVDSYTEYMDPARFPEAGYPEALKTFLQAKYRGRHFDLIIGIDVMAYEFLRRYRDDVFPGSRVVFFSAPPGSTAFSGATGLTAASDFRTPIESALQLQPDTTTVVMVAGASAYDKRIEAAARAQVEPLKTRVSFTYLSGLKTADLLAQVARLGPRTIVFFLSFSQDGQGRNFVSLEMIESLSAVSSVPTYSWLTVTLGRGVVGGRMQSLDLLVTHVSELALRVLRGEDPDTIPVSSPAVTVTSFDWRQLHRWGLDRRPLPPGSLVLFRRPGAWDQYRGYIVGGIALFALQAALIGGLLVQRSRRRHVERALCQTRDEIEAFAGRLIAAQDDERSRIARDLHDDVSQELAALSIELSGLKRRFAASGVPDSEQATVVALQKRTIQLADSVRHLSHELHPGVLQHSGLVPALTAHCDELRRQHGLPLTLDVDGSFEGLDATAALCLYRVAQEALRNVVTHASAGHASVRLLRTGTDIELTVEDDGCGFDLVKAREGRGGLGLISIAERVRLAGGSWSLVTDAKKGTLLTVHLPAPATLP